MPATNSIWLDADKNARHFIVLTQVNNRLNGNGFRSYSEYQEWLKKIIADCNLIQPKDDKYIQPRKQDTEIIADIEKSQPNNININYHKRPIIRDELTNDIINIVAKHYETKRCLIENYQPVNARNTEEMKIIKAKRVVCYLLSRFYRQSYKRLFPIG